MTCSEYHRPATRARAPTNRRDPERASHRSAAPSADVFARAAGPRLISRPSSSLSKLLLRNAHIDCGPPRPRRARPFFPSSRRFLHAARGVPPPSPDLPGLRLSFSGARTGVGPPIYPPDSFSSPSLVSPPPFRSGRLVVFSFAPAPLLPTSPLSPSFPCSCYTFPDRLYTLSSTYPFPLPSRCPSASPSNIALHCA